MSSAGTSNRRTRERALRTTVVVSSESMTEQRPLRVLQLQLWLVEQGGGTQTYVRALLQAFRGDARVRLHGAALHAGVAPEGFAAPPHVGGAGRVGDLLGFMRHVAGAARAADLVQINGIYGAQFLFGAPCCWLL